LSDLWSSLYGALRDYDQSNALAHQKSLDSWVATYLEGEERLRTQALYRVGSYVEVLDNLIHSFRYHVRTGFANPVVAEARQTFLKGDYSTCLSRLAGLLPKSFPPLMVVDKGRPTIFKDKLEFLRLNMDCNERLENTEQAQMFSQRLQAMAKKSIPELLNGIVSGCQIEDQLRQTIQSYLELHDKFP